MFQGENPFGLFILAHLQVWATEGNDEARAQSKVRLLLRACSLKMSLEDEIDRPVLLRLIDWLLPLPREGNEPIWRQVREFQEGQTMPFVSWFEEREQKRADEAEAKALRRGIGAVLKVRFGADGEALAAQVLKQQDLEWLRRFLDLSETRPLDELRKLLP